MPSYNINLSGFRYGTFIVQDQFADGRWACLCTVCNIITWRKANDIQRFKTTKCRECAKLRPSRWNPRKDMYGLDATMPEYAAITSAIDRCTKQHHPQYADYGGRGISVYPDWIKNKGFFYLYLGPRPSPDHSLDRYPDNDGNYEPGNVRWATRSQQMRNRGRKEDLDICCPKCFHNFRIKR